MPNIAVMHVGPRPSVLGRRAARIPTGGKIRAGIKVLTKAAAAQAGARKLYDDGLATGMSFDQIEQLIRHAFPHVGTPMAPKNVPWFTAHPGDFANRAVADRLLELYGEERADGVRRLYRFPVLFPADQWQLVMPHELVAWGSSGRKFWSEYSPDGHTRHCMRYAAPALPNGRRVIRLFGGRQPELRPDNGGQCEPQQCEQYQSKACNLSGAFIFYVPGIPSLDAFELHTNSFYALSRAIEKFDTLAALGNGKISGFLDQQGATFIMTKQLREVSHINEHGQPERAEHWLIELEAPIDMGALLRGAGDRQLLERGEAAALMLEGPAALPAAEAPSPQASTASHTAVAQDAHAALPARQPALPSDDLERIRQLARAGGADPDRFLQDVDHRLGQGWRRNARARASVEAELTAGGAAGAQP
ncbi:recombination directionality factor [Rugamonas aquatica]|uniref:Uncharacterized protein n=1 Tax=Rugamonas aquatica TaxID=2743357 RepID=A0A6A7N6Z3_9BURK|nr:hypothetical protein [Rugamonas aquatica]MQA40652.1 hypothetical protein [Rugamonas aquatica]